MPFITYLIPLKMEENSKRKTNSVCTNALKCLNDIILSNALKANLVVKL